MLCPCGTKESYSNCCQPLHEGNYPQNALELMRSRYSAYALQNPEYIIRTTHPQNPQYKQDHKLWRFEILYFCQNTIFKKLVIVDFIDGDTEAYVTFSAHLEQANNTHTLNEKSYFVKVGPQWLYRDGIIYPNTLKS